MPKSPKPKKAEKALDGKSSAKKKAGKKKVSDSSKINAETEDIKNVVIEDEKWQCSIVLLVSQTHSIHNFLQQMLVDLPENFTVLTKDTIANKKEKTSPSKSRKGSKPRTSDRSASKSSKQSGKTKKSKNETKKEEVEETKHFEDSSNDEVDSFKVGLALKELIIGLRNTDIANTDKASNKTDIQESKIKSKDLRTRGSGDEKESKINEKEERLINYENIFHRFVILLGFYDPLLLEVLIKQNVSIKAVINVRNATDNISDTYSKEKLTTVTGKSKRKPSSRSKKGSVDGKISNAYSVFLEKMVSFSSSAEFLETCKDVIFLNYTIVKNLPTITKEIGPGFKYKSDIMDILYKIQNSWNKYKVYIETIHIQNIPTDNEIIKLDEAKIYSTMISMVPLECTSIAVILYCMVEQISWWSDDKHYTDETNSSLLGDNGTDRYSRSASKSFGKNKTPILINHRDEIKYNTFHLDLPEFDFELISTNVFMKCPVFRLWERYQPHPKAVQKWFDFQLEKLRQNLGDNCILKLDSLFPIYLHYLLMDVLILKTNQFTNSNHDSIGAEQELEKVHQAFSFGKEPEVCDVNANVFIKNILYNILCKVPNFSLCQNYAEVFELPHPHTTLGTTESCLEQPVYLNRLRNKSTKELPGETLLQKRERHKQQKLNKLVSFLNCSEFVSLYEDFPNLNLSETNRWAKYGFIETLNTQTMCQCLQIASQSFNNINYDYFPVTDSILLWFNNSVQDQILSTLTSKGILETPLGFRDFFLYKLRESTDFGDLIEREVVSRTSAEENGVTFVDEPTAVLEPQTVNYSEDSEKQSRAKASNPTIAYNLSSLWTESTESSNNFFSTDSSSVTVRRSNYFSKKPHIDVKVNKNNTSLRYNLYPESPNHLIHLFIDVGELLIINCVLEWNTVFEKSSPNHAELPNNFESEEDSKHLLNCSLSVTLLSGLVIEVVPTNSIFGPFYVRQRYLVKGPNCSRIWDETYRCYLNSGMVLIFRADGSVDVLYSNGTTVKCTNLELIKPDNLLPEDKVNKINKSNKEAVQSDLNQDRNHITEGGQKSQSKKKGIIKASERKSRSDLDGKETNKQSQKKKGKAKKGSKTPTENLEVNTSLVKETEDNKPWYKVVQHSVLSWDGECSQYESGDCTDKKKCLSMRTAFDVINHELYWQRSDGMSALQAPGNLSLQYPDGSKTTTFTIDSKKLFIENDYGFIYHNNGDLVKVEPLTGSLSNNNATGGDVIKGNGGLSYKQYLAAADASSIDDSVGSEHQEENDFVYIENSFLMEHTNYASVEYSNEEHELKLILPGNCWLIVNESGQFSFKGDKNERIILFNNSLLFEANVLSSSTLSKSSTKLRFENVDTVPIIFSQTEDSFGNVFSVDERGNTTYLPSVNGENYDRRRSSVYSARFPQNTERFFVFNRDLTGYEMIHEVEQESDLSSNEDMKTVKCSIIKDESELYSLYMQSPIYISKCDEFIMHDIEKVAPSLIKRKDLLKVHKTPKTIWFYPDISTVKKLKEENEMNSAQPVKTLKAMITAQRLKVKRKGLDVASLFFKALTKYMESNEQLYKKYSNYHPTETLKEEDLIGSENNRTNFLGSKSYYLTDNLPVVITGGMADKNEPNKDIFRIFSPSVSNTSF